MLQSIQNELQSLYQISCKEGVEDFLLPEDSPQKILTSHPWIHHSDEALLVEQSHGNLELGLWLKPELLEWSQDLEWEQLKQEAQLMSALPKVATLIEGVSHFVYLLWKAGEDRCVTQLELELQAEVDKFVILSKYFMDISPRELMGCLFDNVTWNPYLGSEDKARYVTAVKLASQYCDHLRQHYSHFSEEKFLPEVRAFYRMNQAEKIRHIS